MKSYRLGSAESTVIFMYYLINIINICNIEDPLISCNHWLIPHLYYSSGYYDKSFEKVPFNETSPISIHEWIAKSDVISMFNSHQFQKYCKQILDILNECDNLEIIIKFFNNELDYYKDDFIKYLKCKNDTKHYVCEDQIIYYSEYLLNSFIENKNLLIINSMSELMKLQYDSGNLHKINENFAIINNIVTYTMTYTFFNDGPDNNIFETVDSINNQINNLNFDCAIVSAGAYSCLIANHINVILNKPVLIQGGHLIHNFGIICKRHKEGNYIFNNLEYWLNVPDNYKPANYLNIERGCYW